MDEDTELVKTDGFYEAPNEAPIETLKVEYQSSDQQLLVNLQKGSGDPHTYRYRYGRGEWTLIRPDDVIDRKESDYSSDEVNAMRIHTIESHNGSRIHQKTVERFVFMDWGYAKTNEIQGIGNVTRTTS